MKAYKENNNSVLIIGGAILFIIAVLLGGYLMNNRGTGDTGDSSVPADTDDVQPAIQDSPDSEVAIIDGIPLMKSEFDKDINIILFVQGMPLEYRTMVPEGLLLNQTIIQELIYRQSVENGYSQDNEVVREEFESKLEGEGVSVDDYKADLAGMPFTYEDVIGFYAKQKAMGLYLNDTLFSSETVDLDEARAYYDENQALFFTTDQVSASHILVDSEELAVDLIKQLDEGADFAELAKEHSTCPSAPEGGDLGTFGSGDMVPEFEEAAFGMEEIGDYSSVPVKTQFGYHIILLTGKTEAGQLTFEDASEGIIQQLTLQKRQVAVDGYMAGLLDDADIVIK